jgi:hypothetical protein
MKLQFAITAVLFSMLFAQASLAGAPASTVDPLRDRIGQIVYPPGVKAPPADSSSQPAGSNPPQTTQTTGTGTTTTPDTSSR